MTTQLPPPRYRVVEQGRRLVVIDTRTGQPAARGAPTPGPPLFGPSAIPTLPHGPERTAFDGRSTLVTHPIYDAKAPRTLLLSGEETRLFGGVRVVAVGAAALYGVLAVFFQWLLLPLALLLDQRVRRALRGTVTRWLDRYDTPSAG